MATLAELADFFDLKLWPLVALQPLDLQERTTPHFKGLIHICLEPKAQGIDKCRAKFNRDKCIM
jgi:hypothetical protein